MQANRDTNRTAVFLAGFFALTTLGLAILANREHLAVIRLTARLADPAVGVERQLADAQVANRKLRAEVQTARAGAAASAAAGGPDSRQFTVRGNLGSVFNDPAFQRLAAIQQKAALDGQYGALFKALNLSPEKVEQLKNLLIQKQQAPVDALQAARDQGLNSDLHAVHEAIVAAQASAEDQIKGALGASGYAQYQQFNQTAPERSAVTQMQQALSYTATPLTDEQSQQLLQTLVQTGAQADGMASGSEGNQVLVRAGAAGIVSFGSGPGPQSVPVTDEAISQAAAYLAPDQVQALKQLQAQQQAAQQLQQLLRAGLGQGADGPIAAPAPGR
jgi:hypothetical protein